jgi:hypothetical protein
MDVYVKNGPEMPPNEPATTPPVRVEREAGRNDPCPCGSGRKYKHCHLRQFNETMARKHADLRSKHEGSDREKARLVFRKKASAS